MNDLAIEAIEKGNSALAEQHATIQKQKLELAQLRDAFDDAVALLRDWEDYDADDVACGWLERRNEFLAEHEEAGR